MSTGLMRRKSERHELVLDVDRSTNEKEKRKNVNKYWQLALTAITFRSRTLKSVYRIDRMKLNELVENKNFEMLQELGEVDGVARKLRTSADHGIDDDDEDIRRRRNTFGANTFQSPPKKGFCHFLRKASLKFKVFILIICGTVSLGFGLKVEGSEKGWTDGTGMLIELVFSILFVAMSEHWHDRILEKSLQKIKNIEIDVVRGGSRKQIPIFEIVVGDVLCLKPGDQIPTHGLLLEGTNHSLQLQQNRARNHQGVSDESTDLSNPTRDDPFLFYGAKVVDGFARMLVTSVGMDAKGAQLMSETNCNSWKESPLQLEAQLEELDWISDLVTSAGFVFMLVASIIFLVKGASMTDDNDQPLHGIAKINAIVELLVEVITVLIDTSDPWKLSLTCTRAYAMKKTMAGNNAMVLNPSSLETLGCASIICTDKTGVLTTYEMQVDRLWLGKEEVEKGTCLSSSAYKYVVELLREGIALNTTGSVYNTSSTSGSDFEISGSPTEKAILSWAVRDLKMDMESAKRSHDILRIEAFNSERKRSGILVKGKVDNTMQMHWKGAAELILTMCSSYYVGYGNTKALDHDQRMEFTKTIEGMAASRLRCIAFAHKIVSPEQFQCANKDEMLKDEFVLVGFIGISSCCRPRPEVKKVVEKFQSCGVKIQMITGDDIITAKATATECGILTCDKDKVIEAVEFRSATAKQRREMADEIRVMARASPSDKHLLVECLKDKDHIVAVTGDNINDIEALKAANVGIFMGLNQWTRVAKESSDIIISDCNLASVLKALRWGRSVYSNVQKFVQFNLTVSISSLVATVIGLFSIQALPLSAVQFLWVSLITDSLGSLAFATEKPAKEDMKKPPVPCKTEPILTNILLRNILPQSMYQIVLLTLIHLHQISSVFGVSNKAKDTFIFSFYVLCQVFNEFNSRKLEKKNVLAKIQSSKLFLAIVAITVALQVLLVEFLKNFAETERLNWSQWGSCVGLAALTLPIGLLARCLYIRDKPFISRMWVGRMKGWIKRRIFAKLRSLSTWAYQVLVRMRRNRRGGLILPITHDSPSHSEPS